MTSREECSEYVPPEECPEDVPREECPEDVPPEGCPEDVPREGCPEDVPREECPEDVPREECPEDVPREENNTNTVSNAPHIVGIYQNTTSDADASGKNPMKAIFQCPLCLKKYSTKTNLNRHHAQIHCTPSIPCSMCQKRFATPTNSVYILNRPTWASDLTVRILIVTNHLKPNLLSPLTYSKSTQEVAHTYATSAASEATVNGISKAI